METSTLFGLLLGLILFSLFGPLKPETRSEKRWLWIALIVVTALFVGYALLAITMLKRGTPIT